MTYMMSGDLTFFSLMFVLVCFNRCIVYDVGLLTGFFKIKIIWVVWSQTS